jgi:hypothetical protein
MIGFFAGGLLAVATATGPSWPNFVVPVYAATPTQMSVRTDSPPAFIMVAEDDRYGTDWSLDIYRAWHAAHVPVEMHIYARGNLGFALRRNGIPTDSWNDRLLDWMKLLRFLPTG